MDADTQEIGLQEKHWDCCIIGNGVSALWLTHLLWSSKKSVLWITEDTPYSSPRAMLQHGWLWGLPAEMFGALARKISGFDSLETPFELAYYDAKSAKRFRTPSEVKVEWGPHEKKYFEPLLNLQGSTLVDLWQWHQKIYEFHQTGDSTSSSYIELFSDPRLVRIQAQPILELKTNHQHQLDTVVLAGFKKEETIRIQAEQFYIGDYAEYLPALIQNAEDSQALSQGLKGRSYRAGFGLHFWHGPLENSKEQTLILPMTVQPSDRKSISHIVGRFIPTQNGLESVWISFLSDEEMEDNNEILKKIKQAKRAVDRGVPGFSESIQREAVSFEPRMLGLELVKTKHNSALGAQFISDYAGMLETVQTILSQNIPENTGGEKEVVSELV